MNTYLLINLTPEDQKILHKAKYSHYLGKGAKALVLAEEQPSVGTLENCIEGNAFSVCAYWLNAPVATILDELHEKSQANPPQKGELKRALAEVVKKRDFLKLATDAVDAATTDYKDCLYALGVINGRTPFLLDGEPYHLSAVKGGTLTIRKATYNTGEKES